MNELERNLKEEEKILTKVIKACLPIGIKITKSYGFGDSVCFTLCRQSSGKDLAWLAIYRDSYKVKITHPANTHQNAKLVTDLNDQRSIEILKKLLKRIHNGKRWAR